jgi:catechol 2,3-dioxygenase-like lactoylglutathione lyase family enzyme
MITHVLHTGVRVADLQKSIELYQKLGFRVEEEFTKPEPKCKAAIMKKGEIAFELFEFEDVAHEYVKYISNHIAFYSDDIEHDVADFVAKGYKLVIPINDGTLLRFAYVQDPSGAFCYELATEKKVTS